MPVKRRRKQTDLSFDNGELIVKDVAGGAGSVEQINPYVAGITLRDVICGTSRALIRAFHRRKLVKATTLAEGPVKLLWDPVDEVIRVHGLYTACSSLVAGIGHVHCDKLKPTVCVAVPFTVGDMAEWLLLAEHCALKHKELNYLCGLFLAEMGARKFVLPSE